MPVLTLMVWDLLDWEAWPSPRAAVSLESVSGGNAPPSRLMASWILVSFVSRARAAHLGGWEVDDILQGVLEEYSQTGSRRGDVLGDVVDFPRIFQHFFS